MEVIKTEIEDVVIIEPRLFKDERGYFFESFSQGSSTKSLSRDFRAGQREHVIVRRYAWPAFPTSAVHAGKVSEMRKGAVLDVAVDIRKGSPTYGRHVAVELTEDNHRQFFIPKGFAHGFAVLSETAMFLYKCDEFYHPEADGGISILDGSLGIDWCIPTEHAILSEKDTKHPLLKDFESPFIYK